MVSVSGGKDSTAVLLLAIEREVDNLEAVFADTGNEHEITYDYVRYLEQATGVAIRWVRADFRQHIEGKRAYVEKKWPEKLLQDVPGSWVWIGSGPEDPENAPRITPADPHASCADIGGYRWRPTLRGMSADQAAEVVAMAVQTLRPTGNPFLDLCVWKGRFPSTKVRFCSEELKRNPIIEQVQMPLLEAGESIESWQGVRRDESRARANLPERDLVGEFEGGAQLWNYRPIIDWKAKDCFALAKRHGIEPNPLYKAGMGRVGCMPCINARKDELLEIAKRFPEAIERIARWEKIVSLASKRQMATFFAAATIDSEAATRVDIGHATHGIYAAVNWSKTSRGGRQFDIFRTLEGEAGPLCSSMYGLCE